ncbi:MAG: hemolysin, partial [Clostridiales bacterium]|nr:hemolysin [Clostridiales bacterium]
GSSVETDEFESIGGYLLGQANELPEEGTVIRQDGISFIIEKVDSNRIETIRVKIDPPSGEERELLLEKN